MHGQPAHMAGKSTLTFDDDSIFIGSLNEAGELLEGIITYPSGDIYAGTLHKGVPHGQGKMTFANGSEYKGTFVFGNVAGKGTLVLLSVGEDGVAHRAEFTGMFGRKVVGGQNDPHAKVFNTLTFRGVETAKGWAPVDADTEVVANADNVEHAILATGEGSIKFSVDGRVFQGTFEHGRPSSTHGQMQIPSGDPASRRKGHSDLYSGESSTHGLPTGRGRLECYNGDVFSGEFKRGYPSGRCRAEYATGDAYEGEMLGGLRHGRGALQLNTGEVYEGKFEEGQYQWASAGSFTPMALSSRDTFEMGRNMDEVD